MNETEVLSILNEIFRSVFDDESLAITYGTTANDIEDWDSLEQVNLLFNISKRFNIKIDLSEVSKLKNVGDMVDFIVKKIAR